MKISGKLADTPLGTHEPTGTPAPIGSTSRTNPSTSGVLPIGTGTPASFCLGTRRNRGNFDI